jgi:hypothetical protein
MPPISSDFTCAIGINSGYEPLNLSTIAKKAIFGRFFIVYYFKFKVLNSKMRDTIFGVLWITLSWAFEFKIV